MTEKLPVNLGAVQETLLIPLLGRAHETARPGGLIHDPKAVEIVERLDYDFSKWEKARSLAGATVRTRMFDTMVSHFLADHPSGTVVELGCGLNTRADRLDNGQATWFDLDLPDVIELRRSFFANEPRRTMLAASVLETDWMDTVAVTGGPWMFVSEAVLIYLDAAQVRQAMTQIAGRFAPMWLAFDTCGQKMVDGQARHDAMKHMSQDSWFVWACDDPREIEEWDTGLELLESKSFLDADQAIIDQMPRPYRLVARFAPFVMRRVTSQYRLNVAGSDNPSPATH
ncbi:MAG: class I SAM-dependent methyltransferase [Actinomycetota bacterium]